MNITLKHLRVFVEVAHQGSFTRAAERLSLSQPALTIAVGQFEESLGVRLFDRTTRRVSLTSDGEDFLATAERLLEDFDVAVADMRDLAERRRGRVGIAALPSVALRLLPEVVADFSKAYPGVRIHLQDANARGVQERVQRKEVDFGIGSLWEPDPELAFEALIRDPFVMVCRREHPLARGKGPLPWRRLAGHDFIGMGRDTGIRPLIHAVRDLPEAVQMPKCEVSSIPALEGMLEAGLGVAALPLLAVPTGRSKRLVSRRLVEPVVEREIGLLTRRGRSLSPAAEQMRSMLVESLSGPDKLDY